MLGCSHASESFTFGSSPAVSSFWFIMVRKHVAAIAAPQLNEPSAMK